MRILIITPYISPTYGGTSKAVAEIVESLASLNVEVDLVTTNANGVTCLEIPLNTWITKNGYRVCYFPSWHKNDLVFSHLLISWLFHHVADYDIVHTHTIFSPLMSFVHWICQIRKIPYLMTPHGMLDPWALAYKAWKKKLYLNLFEKASLKSAKFIQVLATAEADCVNSLGLQQSVLVPNGIHCYDFQSLPNPNIFFNKFPQIRDKTLILFLGRIDPKKGLDLLASAFAKVHQKFPQTHLIVAGPDSIGFLPTVETYFQQAGCLDVVTFTGMLTGELKLAALAATSLYVAPSYSEGFSMSVLEGMASGLPCVITTGCNFPEAKEVAHVVEINADAIGNALIECLNNPQESKLMGLNARKFIFDNYTWQEVARKLLHLYSAIANSKSTVDITSNAV
jgi:glycosyltransferase involved in cell wall biosynthesis